MPGPAVPRKDHGVSWVSAPPHSLCLHLPITPSTMKGAPHSKTSGLGTQTLPPRIAFRILGCFTLLSASTPLVTAVRPSLATDCTHSYPTARFMRQGSPVVQASLRSTRKPRLTQNIWSSCLHFLSAGLEVRICFVGCQELNPQGFVHARQALHALSYIPSPKYSFLHADFPSPACSAWVSSGTSSVSQLHCHQL